MEMSQYLEVFIEESKEHLQTVNEQLLGLEKDPENLAIVNEIFRSAHTLKGMAATMGYEDLTNLTHKMENVLDGIRNNKIKVNSDILDVVFSSIDDLEAMIYSIAGGGDGKRNVEKVVKQLQLIEQGKSPKEEGIAPSKEGSSSATGESSNSSEAYDEYEVDAMRQSVDQGSVVYEITVQLREDCMLKAARVYMSFEILEEAGEVIKSFPSVEALEAEKFDFMFSVTLITKEAAEVLQKRLMQVSEIDMVEVRQLDVETVEIQGGQTEVVEEKEEVVASVVETPKAVEKVKSKETKETKEAAQPASAGKGGANKTIRVNIERLDILMNLFEELVIDRGRLEQISHELSNAELHETVERMSRVTGDLQNIILTMRMVPVDTVFSRYPRVVRQIARDLGKKVTLEIIGAETELDRTVIDEIGDPLVHLIRNSLDHGVEMPDVRAAQGKPEMGTVKLRAYHSGNHVFIEIEDDGAGIKRERVLQKALSKEIVTEQAAELMTNRQVCELIFAPGFSTADVISDISGRGVGLDVVKTTIESLGGSVTVDSEEGKGSLFSIQLPLTLSIISVMLVEIQQEKYAIPLSSIIETAIVKKEDILHAHNQKVIDFRGKVVPLLFLKDIFEVPVTKQEEDYFSVVIARKGEKMSGLVVDSFIGQQEVVLKTLGNYLTSAFAISGATILGDGQVALIVDCNALIK